MKSALRRASIVGRKYKIAERIRKVMISPLSFELGPRRAPRSLLLINTRQLPALFQALSPPAPRLQTTARFFAEATIEIPFNYPLNALPLAPNSSQADEIVLYASIPNCKPCVSLESRPPLLKFTPQSALARKVSLEVVERVLVSELLASRLLPNPCESHIPQLCLLLHRC